MTNPVGAAAAAAAMLCLIFAPAAAVEHSRDALVLCAELIVPSLLPFFTASALLIRLQVPQLLARPLAPAAKRLWGVSGAGAAVFLSGICGGYPLGAQSAAELYRSGQISKAEAEKLLGFCNNSGPSFLIGVIGCSLFSSRAAGLLLYAIHVLSAALTGVLLRNGSGEETKLPQAEPVSFASALVDSVRQAVISVLSVCGFIVCFCVFTGLLDSFGVFDAAAKLLAVRSCLDRQELRAFLIGLLELSNGVASLRGLPLTPTRFILTAFVSGWGGLSVQFQTLAVLQDTDLSAGRHLTGRLLHAVISTILAFAATRLFLLSPLPNGS